MKKIIWITTEAFIDTDYYILKEIRDCYEIDVYVLIRKGEPIDFISELYKYEGEAFKIEVINIGNRYRDFKNLAIYKNLFRRINGEGYDLLYATLSNPPYFIPCLKKNIDVKKVILAIHNVHVPKGGTKYYFNKIYNRFAISKFENYQTFSKAQRDYLNMLAPDKSINYAPFFLKDYGKVEKAHNHELITFLTFGNIRPYKRIDILIKAAQMAFEKTKKTFKVIIAGDCPNWDDYERIIRFPDLFDVRIGHVDNKDIPALFEESDYFVAPYQDIAQSGSIIVAVNYEKPIIASRLPAFEEVITDGENGYLIEPANLEDLTGIIVKILENHLSTYNELVNKQIKNKEDNYSDEAIKKKYVDFIEQIGE